MGVGIGLPEFGRIFAPYPLTFMMFLLFFSFLKIDFLQVFHDIRKKAFILFILCFFKLCIIPVGLFFLTQALWPEYAVPVLLLSGISTGVVAPFISGLLEASTLLVLMMVVVSSLLSPFFPSGPGLPLSRTNNRNFFFIYGKDFSDGRISTCCGSHSTSLSIPFLFRKIGKGPIPGIVILVCLH